MGRLAQAVEQMCRPLSVDELAAILRMPRATAGRWQKALLDDGKLHLWSADAIEALAAYEADRLGTTSISDALRPVIETGNAPSPREVRRQIDKADRKNSSLKLDLDDIESHGTFDPARARAVLEKADAAIKETSGHHNLLVRWRNSLMRKLRDGR